MSNYTKLNKSYINGQWVDGQSDQAFDITNPYDEEVLATVKLCTLPQVEEAFDIAHAS